MMLMSSTNWKNQKPSALIGDDKLIVDQRFLKYPAQERESETVTVLIYWT